MSFSSNMLLIAADWEREAIALKAEVEQDIECDSLLARVKAMESLVTRFRAWDALDIPDTDGAFWKREIDAVITPEAAPKKPIQYAEIAIGILSGRAGFDWWWDELDEDLAQEIMEEIDAAIKKETDRDPT